MAKNNYGYEGSDQYRPLSPWEYFGYSILYAIPLVGFIFLIIHSCNVDNINRQNFARSFWCMALLVVAITIVTLLVTGASLSSLSSTRYY